MHRFVIERDVPDVGNLTDEQLRATSESSVNALCDMGPSIQWVQSYVTSDRIYCIYLAESEQLVREHAARAGIPASKISRAVRVIDPLSANTPQH